jgi:SAM-dependent methyltransferase
MTHAEPQLDSGLQLEEVPCDFCGATAADLLLVGRDRMCGVPGMFHVVTCRQCGLARTNPRPTLATLGRAYTSDYVCHQESTMPSGAPQGFLRWALVNYGGYPLGRRAPALVRWLAWLPASARLRNRKLVYYLPYEGQGRLLDFGCGVGRYVALMSAAGWKAEGIDLSAAAVKTGRDAGLTLHEGTLPGTALPEASYDLVMMCHALEHVPSPMATLKAVRPLLGPGGRLVVVCPLIDSLASQWLGAAWFGIDVPRHLTHFTQVTLRRHLEAAGFVVERAQPIRRPVWLRRSFEYLADDTGRAIHRRLAKSRLVARLASHWELLLGRTDEVLFVARRS